MSEPTPKTQKITSKSVHVVGAGYRGGQPKLGVDKGPQAIRSTGFLKEVKEMGWEVVDNGDLQFGDFKEDKIGKMVNPTYVGEACGLIYKNVKEGADKKQFCLTLGGDHSLAIGTIGAMCDSWENLSVLWVDAHADINTEDTTPTGNIHGMPVSFLNGTTKNIPGFGWLNPKLKNHNIAYIGLRDVDHGEKDLLKNWGIKTFDMDAVDELGIGKVMDEALKYLNVPNQPLHLSFDIDGVDPEFAPATGTAVKGGLSFREGRHICHRAWKTGALVGLDMVEVNPSLAPKEKSDPTAQSAADLILAAMGKTLTKL